MLASWFLAYPTIFVSVKRLHDLNKTGGGTCFMSFPALLDLVFRRAWLPARDGWREPLRPRPLALLHGHESRASQHLTSVPAMARAMAGESHELEAVLFSPDGRVIRREWWVRFLSPAPGHLVGAAILDTALYLALQDATRHFGNFVLPAVLIHGSW
jgi:uncharacterized membrane protein YhaH (DUF805 family)